MIKKLIKGLKNPKIIIRYLLGMKVFRIISDKTYIKLKYYLRMGEKLDFKNLETFNEKLQWLKLYDRKSEYTNLVDKYEVRKYIAKTIGKEFLIPLLGVYDKFEDIKFDKLPNQFVLKPNHTSGDIYICKDKNKIDYNKLKKEVNSWLKKEYYWYNREWPYKYIKPRILCEKFLKAKDGSLPNDYKFHCFNGEPDNVMVCIERDSGIPKFFFFDKKWNLLRYIKSSMNAPEGLTLPKPSKIDEMFKIATELSKGLLFIRVDLYYENDKIYFGEMTFFPQNGFDSDLLKETDVLFGDKIKLDKQQKNGACHMSL